MTGKLVTIVFLIMLSGHLGHAQSNPKLPIVGYVTIRSTPSEQNAMFKQALRELGWIEGKNYILEWRGTSASLKDLDAGIAELSG